MIPRPPRSTLFFFNDTATTEIYTLSLHDALPISRRATVRCFDTYPCCIMIQSEQLVKEHSKRSEEHTSELQSRPHLVCRLLLEKKKNPYTTLTYPSVSSTCGMLRSFTAI